MAAAAARRSPTRRRHERVEAVYELALLDAGVGAAGARTLGRSRRHRPASPRRWRSVELLEAYLDALERGEVPHVRPPWARPAGATTSRAWIEVEVRRLGRRSPGSSRSSTGASRRSSVFGRRPDLYFKASAPLPLFVRGGHGDRPARRALPGLCARAARARAGTGWMLLTGSTSLSWDAPLDLRCEIFRRFAGLQRRTADRRTSSSPTAASTAGSTCWSAARPAARRPGRGRTG